MPGSGSDFWRVEEVIELQNMLMNSSKNITKQSMSTMIDRKISHILQRLSRVLPAEIGNWYSFSYSFSSFSFTMRVDLVQFFFLWSMTQKEGSQGTTQKNAENSHYFSSLYGLLNLWVQWNVFGTRKVQRTSEKLWMLLRSKERAKDLGEEVSGLLSPSSLLHHSHGFLSSHTFQFAVVEAGRRHTERGERGE